MSKPKPPYPAYVDRKDRAQTRPHAVHAHNPAGSKQVLRWFKAKHGTQAKTVGEAWTWYRNYNPTPV